MAFLTKTKTIGKWLSGSALDVLFPPRCFGCGVFTGEAANLCSDCWQGIDFISDPLCRKCGTPFPHNLGDSALCITCMETPPAYLMARSVFLYTDASRSLVTGYKYHDRTQATPMFRQWLHRAALPFWEEAEWLIPVPLHRSRLIRRRYNQAALLAGALAKASGKTAVMDGLARIRRTPAQAGLNRKERHENVRGAFAVNPKYSQKIKGKKVMLMDDVMTTGATLQACTEALLEAGADAVFVLTLARTLPGEI